MVLDSLCRSGLFALLSGVIWLLLSPFMTTIGFCQGPCSIWTDKPLMIRAIGPWLTQQGWLSFAPGNALYFIYGRYFFLVYLCLGLALRGLHQVQIRPAPCAHRLTRWSYWFLLGFLLIAALGDFVSYGLGVVSDSAWRDGFGVEMLAWSGIVVGSILYGITILRVHRLPRWTGWLLITGALLLPLMFFDRTLVMYWPNAQLLPYCGAWTIVGGYQLLQWYQSTTSSGANTRAE